MNKFAVRNINRAFRCLLSFGLMLILCLAVHTPARAAMLLTVQPYAPYTDTEMELTWSSVPAALFYSVFRSEDGGVHYDLIDTLDVSQVLELRYIDRGLTPGTVYHYKVEAFSDPAYNPEDANPDTPVDTAFSFAGTTAMIPPGGLSVKYNINAKTVTVLCSTYSKAAVQNSVWDSNGPGANELGSAVVPLQAPSAITFFPDTGALGEKKTYYVNSRDADGNVSAYSQQGASITLIAPPEIAASIQNGTVTVSWNAWAGREFIQEFSLERSVYNGSTWGPWETVVSSLPAGAGSITNTPAAPGVYRYRLSAKENGSYSGYSNISNTVYKPGAPTALTCTSIATDRIRLNWTNAQGNVSGLYVQRMNSSGHYENISTLLPAEYSSFEDIYNFSVGTTYYYRIVAYDSASNLAVSPVSTIIHSVPAAPSSLQLTVETDTCIRLTWDDRSNNEEGFRIERADGSGSYTELYVSGPGATTYQDSTVTAGNTYSYRVRAYNSLGNSGYSPAVTVSAGLVAVPSSLEATPVSGSRIDLKWSYPGTGAYNTVIERTGGEDTSWRTIATISAGMTEYADTYNLSPNTRYYYRIRSVLGSVSSIYFPNTSGIEAMTALQDISLNAAPVSGNRILLSWNDVTGTTQYTIERKDIYGTYSVVAILSSAVTSWHDTAVAPNGQYIYRVKASSAQNQQTYSNEVQVANVYIEAPSGLVAGINDEGYIELSWVDNSISEDGFEIHRWSSLPTYTSKRFKVDDNVTVFTDTEAVYGVQYYYYVRAYSSLYDVYSSASNSVTMGVGILTPPDGLDYTAQTNTSIQLKWQDNSNNESGFKVERKSADSGQWVEIASLAANANTYKVTGLSPNVVYYFRIKAYIQSNGLSSFSNEIEVTTRKPSAPRDLTIEAVSSTSMLLTWADTSDNELGFRIERRAAAEKTYEVIAELDADRTGYTDSGLTPNRRYYYKVSAFNKNGTSTASSQNAVTKKTVTFSDIRSSNVNWAKTAIEDLASRGVITGGDGNKFRPLEDVTRAEFISMVMRAFKLTGVATGSYEDVRPGDWFYNDIMLAVKLGIVPETSGNVFYPHDPITREDMAVIAVRAADMAGKELYRHSSSVLEKYKDKESISPYAISSLATLYGEGLLDRWTGSLLVPKGTLTRAEAAVILYNLLGK